jgi:hypothetical protein
MVRMATAGSEVNDVEAVHTGSLLWQAVFCPGVAAPVLMIVPHAKVMSTGAVMVKVTAPSERWRER